MPTGTGAGGQDVRAGGAFVEIYGKDKLTKQLDAIKSSAKSQVSGLSKLVGGFALVDIAKTGADAAIGMNKFNAAVEEGARVSARMEAAQAKLQERIFAKVGGKLAAPVDLIPEGPERLKFLEQQLDQAQKNLQGVGRDADIANKKVQDLAGGANLFVEKLPFANAGLEADRGEAKREADELNKRREALHGLTDALREQIAAQKAAPGPFTKWRETVDELEKSLQLQLATVGMTADEALLYKMRLDGAAKGVKDIEVNLENVGGLMKEIANRNLFEKTGQGFKDFDKELEFRLRTAGMNPDQVQLEKLKENDRWGLNKENDPNRRGMLAMEADLKRIEEIKRDAIGAKMPNLSRFSSLTAGSFNGSAQSLGTIGNFNRQAVEKVDETNDWLREIFGKLDQFQPVNWK